MAVAQRIGPYEVLEPSSEEVEKVRKRTPKMPGSRAWRRSLAGEGPRYLSATGGCVHHSFLWEEPKGQIGRLKRGPWGLLWLGVQKGWTGHSTLNHRGLGWRGSPAQCLDPISACSLFP